MNKEKTLTTANDSWPFDDGVYFFGIKTGQETQSDARRDANLDALIPNIVGDDGELRTLSARFTGYGLVGARIKELENKAEIIKKIWCKWMREKDPEVAMILSDVTAGIVALSYSNELLGQRGCKECQLCFQKLIPGKDVATLLNTSTGNLMCSGRNESGVFHIYHIACLIHWILFCETCLYNEENKAVGPSPKKKKTASSQPEEIDSIFCPDCQGRIGQHLVEGRREFPCLYLSKLAEFKEIMLNAHKEWEKDPEPGESDHCSTGLYFDPEPEIKTSANITARLKFLRFYRA